MFHVSWIDGKIGMQSKDSTNISSVSCIYVGKRTRNGSLRNPDEEKSEKFGKVLGSTIWQWIDKHKATGIGNQETKGDKARHQEFKEILDNVTRRTRCRQTG